MTKSFSIPGAFNPGQPIQPVLIKYNNKVDTLTWYDERLKICIHDYSSFVFLQDLARTERFRSTLANTHPTAQQRRTRILTSVQSV